MSVNPRTEEAEEWLKWADSDAVPGAQQTTLMRAQIQATLALVEEQRTANLIAFANLREKQTEYYDTEVRREIRERLGVGK